MTSPMASAVIPGFAPAIASRLSPTVGRAFVDHLQVDIGELEAIVDPHAPDGRRLRSRLHRHRPLRDRRSREGRFTPSRHSKERRQCVSRMSKLPRGSDAAKNESPEAEPEVGNVTPIPKPSGFSLDKFKSKRPTIAAGVKTLLGALPHYPLAEAKDFVRLHPDEDAYWSPELCFVDVPIIGQKKDTIHLIDEDLISLLPAGKKVTRHRLALATKPYDVFFLAHVPSVNLDNSWNESNLTGCQLAKTKWVQLASLKDQRGRPVRHRFRGRPGCVS